MNILVTGGGGYIGTLLSKALLEKGFRVSILDNFLYGFESVLHLLPNRNLGIIKGDVRDHTQNYTKDFDIIYHLAGLSGFPACQANPSAAKEINVGATKNLVDGLSPDQSLIYASSTSLYGQAEQHCNEESVVTPVSLYGRTKLEAEQIIMERANSVSLRFATIFGVSPKMRSDLLINEFVYRAIHERSIVLFESAARRTFLHVRDAVDGYLYTMEHWKRMKNEIFNVGDSVMNYSKLEIAEQIKKFTQCTIIDSSIPDLDHRDFYVSFEKIKALGYRAEVTLEEGVEELVQLYRFYAPFSHFKTV